MKRAAAALLAAVLALLPGLAAAASVERPAVLPTVTLTAGPAAALPQAVVLPGLPSLPASAALPSTAVLPQAAVAPQAHAEAPKPQASLPQAQAIATPADPKAGASESKATLDARWDAGANNTAADAPSASASAPLPLAAADQARLDAAVTGLGAVPAPPVKRGKAAAALSWSGLAAAGIAAHAPFTRIGPLVIGVIMAPMLSLMWGVFAGAAHTMSAAREPSGRPAQDADPSRWDAWLEKIRPAAKAAGLPLPARLTVRGGDMVQAQAGGHPGEYELVVHGGIDAFPAPQQDAVLRHELGHIRHYDSWSTAAQMFLATIGPVVAMMAGAVSDERAWAALPLALAAVPLWFMSQRLDEYHADQYAAHAQGSPEALIRFFVADSPESHREAALRAAEGQPAVAPQGFKEKASRILSAVGEIFAGHPTHERRIARLRELAGPR